MMNLEKNSGGFEVFVGCMQMMGWEAESRREWSGV